MAKRDRLSEEAMAAFLGAHPGWERAGDALAGASRGAAEAVSVTRVYTFSDYGAGVGFTVRVALAAEQRDHHPDIVLSWGKVRVSWSTHDAGGVTALDVEMAEQTDRLYGG